jgi:nucleotide sugar dehydrogenase
MDNIKIGILGGGFVGNATKKFSFKKNDKNFHGTLDPRNISYICYDLDPSKRSPPETTFEDLKTTNIIFICVPTPMNKDGSCYTGIVENVIKQIRDTFNMDISSPQENEPHIVVRSTVPVGFCEKMKVHFMPEFLTEKNWSTDFYNCNNWIIGVNKSVSRWEQFQKLMIDILYTSWEHRCILVPTNTILTTSEAEMVKYMRNCFLATKVAFANEMEDFCKISGIDYKNIKRTVALDTRIGSSHLDVPGPDGKHGYGGTCFPKDMNSLKFQFDSRQVECPVISAAIYRNENIDRLEKDWMEDKGRATL